MIRRGLQVRSDFDTNMAVGMYANVSSYGDLIAIKVKSRSQNSLIRVSHSILYEALIRKDV